MNNIIACIPLDEKARRGIPYTPHKGSAVIPCPRCNERVWIGPKQQQKAQEGVPILCINCIVQHGEFSPENYKIIPLGND